MRPVLASILLLHASVAWSASVDPALLRKAESGPVDVLIRMESSAPTLPLGAHAKFAARMQATVDARRAGAAVSQRALRAALDQRGIAHRDFWIVDALQARVSRADLAWLAGRTDVRSIVIDGRLVGERPVASASSEKAAAAIEWGVMRVRAPEVWALGFRGAGIVVSGQDTGYSWDHPALKNAYRGWDGSVANHDYNWHDAIASGDGPNTCGYALTVPCDDNSHGTHTMGTMVGDDGGNNQIGVAPEARWIGCRNMDEGDGTVATYLDCFQWLLAPTKIDGSDPQPALAPQVMNNSWGCPPSEGCTDVTVLDEAIQAAHDGGIFVVVSAGNSGSGCATILDPPALHPASFSVGATSDTDAIAIFSSRGPVTTNGIARVEPDVAAPGVDVRSAILGGVYGSKSGTSMAGPHVAGVAALMMDANPALIGNPDRVAELLRETAIPTMAAQTCGGFPGNMVPNAVFGHGRIDALAAVQAALAELPEPPEPFSDGFESP